MPVTFIPKRFSLAAKFNVLIILLIISTAVGICLFVVRSEMKSYYQDLVNHGKTIAETTAKNCEFGIFTENEAALAPVLERLSLDPDIAYVSVLNREQHTLAARSFKGSGAMQMYTGMDRFASGAFGLREFIDQRDGQRYVEIFCPVVSGSNSGISDGLPSVATARHEPSVIGYLKLGLSQEGMQSRIHQLVVSIIMATSLLVLLGTTLTVVLTRRITSPLKRLTTATREIAQGKFDSPIDVRTSDEVADLGRSLGHMRNSLREYRAAVEAQTSELISTNEKLLQEIGARKAVEEQLLHDALHDTLTGLPNRALFMDRLEHVIALAKRRKDYLFAVLFLDINRFKVVNDSLGHVVGDQLLIMLGGRLVDCLRPLDTVARLSGDEFAILLEDIGGLSNATFIAERIGKALVEPFSVAGHEVFATGSIGIALGSVGYESPDQILRDADTAMYQAKTSGCSHFVVFERGMHEHAVERLRLETDLRKAVERNEFVAFYQPIYSLSTNCLAGFEALARWQHPERGLIMPGEFVRMAEETGIIVAIDRLVLREACRQMVEWQRQCAAHPLEFMSVNLSNKQMVQPDLVDYVSLVLRETGVNPGIIKLEITENVIIDNPEETVTLLSRLKALGVRLYIDDFGTGYSSLSYLHRLPIDGLKIDRSFINRMGKNGENQQVVRTIMLLAQDMNIDVIAEGLETPVQLAQIKSLNCEYGQGYLFSKPVESSEARTLVERGQYLVPNQ
jgi:diguanylate cyclase (GGDEF)-like protein